MAHPPTSPAGVNPDQALIHRFLTQPDTPLAIDSNPMARALGMRLLHADTQGRVTLAFDPDPLFIQGTDVLQGGAVAAMLDFAMAFATMAALPVGWSCGTVNLNTSFQRAAPRGAYMAEGVVERCGRSLAFTHARLQRADDAGHVVASASSTLALLAPRTGRP